MYKVLTKFLDYFKCKEKNKSEWIILNPPEKRRVYYYSKPNISCHNDFTNNYDVVVLTNIVKIKISETTHRLESVNGTKYIVSKDFKFIELDMPDWTF